MSKFKDFPVGKAQQIIIDALGISQPSGFHAAGKIFDTMGIVVSSKRVGRKSVPVVTILPRFGGGFSKGGDGEVWRQYDDYDFSAIDEWVDGG